MVSKSIFKKDLKKMMPLSDLKLRSERQLSHRSLVQQSLTSTNSEQENAERV